MMPSHGVDRLEKCAQPLREIGNRDPVPCAKHTTIVSPMTRPSPSKTADTIPESEAGTSTRPIVWSRLAPSA